ncbi:MAG: DUF3830 family protein [Candidatus Lokiarchaeota archaeon]|nr:DUF3830 family protein [Candidatus Lokiarchaeota archaeon]
MDYLLLENKKLGKLKIRLYKDKAPRTIEKIEKALPLDVNLSRWGDELYGTIPVDAEAENATEECDPGEVALWLDGPAFCILFGKTPASRGSKPRLISPGNVFGKIEGDPSVFKEFDSFKGKLLPGK